MRTNLVQTCKTSDNRINLNRIAMRVALIGLFISLGIGNAWATGSQTFHATSAEPAKGLVYANNSASANPKVTDYTTPSGAAKVGSDGSEGMAFASYAWAMPARGYKFSKWEKNTNGNTAPSGETYNAVAPSTNTGNGDKFTTTVPRMQTHHGWTMATFGANTAAYDVVYKEPIGGSYNVKYEYLLVNTSTKKFTTSSQTLALTSSSGDMRPTDPRDETNHKTYDTDGITLSSSSANFVAWYKDGVQLSTANPYTEYKANANATISALFKLIELGDVTGDLSVTVDALESEDFSVSISTTAHGSWAAGDFTISFAEQTSPKRNDVTKGTVTYVQNSGNVLSSNGTLTIPFTYKPTSWGNTEVQVTVTPTYGDPIVFTILASAVEPSLYEAQLWENGVKTDEGNLVDMVAKANTLTNNPMVRLTQNKTISSPLSLTKSMKFDLNDKTLTCTAAKAFSIDAEGVDVQIVDEGFSKKGTIAVEKADAGNVSVVTFTKKAKLTMQGGTLSATNTGAGGAYGLDVRQGSVFYMTGGNLTVTAATDARGVNVATAGDYATFNGGSVTVTAPTNAYGLWSAGQSNITDATVDVKTTTGTTGYGFYINGGVTTLTDVTTSVSVKTAGAGGGFVKAGRLNVNGGSLAVTAETSDVYGVYIAAGATANIQQNAIITAEATGASGTKVFGINNLGTVNLKNISVTATSPTTAATAVNSQTSAVSTTIEGGTYRANTTGGTAYGLHHQYGALTVDGGTFRAIGSGNSIYGGRAIADGTIANATLHGETQGAGNTAYGFVGGVVGKNISLINCTIEAISNTSKAYAIYSRANVTATGCTLTATTLGENYAYGLYAENGTNHLTDCDATVKAYTINAYGVYHKAGTLTIDRGTYNVEAKQGTASAAQNSLAYGLYNESGQTTTVNGAAFNTLASNNSYSQNAYGAYIAGTLNSTGGTYTAQGKLNVYGIWGHTASTLNLKENTISSRTTNGATSYGIYAKKNFTIDGDIVSAVGTTTGVYAMFFDATNSVGDVLGGKFSAQGNGTNGFGALNAAGTVGNVRLKGGVYKSIVNLQKYTYTGYQVYHLDGTHPDYAAGYRYVISTENPSNYVCRIVGGSYYATLEEALQYTIDNSGSNHTIVMTQHYTLPAGNYRLPSNATLLVPYKFDQTTIAGATPIKINTVGLRENFLCLTFAPDANLNVDGKLEVGGEMYCQESGQICYNNSPYGQLHMSEGSMLQLNSGANLYAWGFITGTGNIIVKKNAKVYEMFQIGDMPTVGNLYDHYNKNDYKFFPFNRYFIQNNEAPTTYYYGSELITAMYIYYKGSNAYHGDNAIKLVGTSGALFLVTGSDESSWVRKSYDAIHDYQVWEVNSSASLGSISLTIGDIPVMGSIPVKSTDYYLPVTNNMKIRVNDGTFTITQTAELLPGSSIEINKTGSLKINSGVNFYVFDKDQWSWPSQYSAVFSPSWSTGSRPAHTVGDAAINVHGNINVLGKLYTTQSIEGGTNATNGANIYSNNEDAGTVHYSTAAGTGTTTVTLMTSPTATKAVTMEAAKLRNGDGTYAQTAGTASGEAWIYKDDQWQKSYTNDCFEVIGSTVYAKPSEYVALKKSQTIGDKLTGVEEDNHTYLTADDKILILMDDCQWWEVEATSDPTVFECKKEEYEGFYYFNTSTGLWELKTVTVTFYSAETGTTVLQNITTDYNGVPNQAVIASNPTKATTAAATYTFYGWKSSVTGDTYHWTAKLEKATANMSYRPVFTENPRHYTITLNDADNGSAVKLEVAYDATPSYTAKKDPTAQYTYTFMGWNPAFTTVTGTKTYTAQWSSTVNKYNITWKNGDDVLETDENQDYGTATAYNGATPTKATDDDYVYTFSKWKSSLNGNSYNNGSTPTVAGETTYEAQYTTTRRYAVTFNNYDGTQLARTIYTQGQTPTYDGLPTRPRDYDGYFRFDGWKNSAGTKYNVGATLPAVTAKETYTAQYVYVTDMFTITLNNVDGNGASWSGKFGEGSTPFYNKNNDDVPVTPAKEGDINHEYTFTGWTPALQPVTANATYTAQFEEHIRKYNITWIIDGVSTTEKVEYGATPSHANPTKDPTVAKTYTFTGWSPAITAVSGDATYTAQFSETTRKYDITWVIDGVSTTEQVAYGTKPTHVNPTKDATAQYTYTFTGWDPAIATVSGDATYTAQFNCTVNKYPITWVDGDGNTIKTDQVEYGTVPNYTGSNPTKTSTAQYEYTFTNWDVTPVAVTGAATYTAQFSSTTRTYTIRFANVDGNGAYEEVVVAYGGTPVCPVVPEKVNGAYEYEFLGWNTPIVAVTGPATYTATYSSTPTERKYTITWLNDDNSLIENTRVLWNVVPTHADPSKAATAQYTYTFAGWDPTPVAVTGPATYKATFNATVNQYEVSFNLQYHGLAILPQTKDYGAKIDQPANPSATGWTFGGWYKEAECTHAWNFASDEVHGTTVLYAKWTINTHKLTWNWDGGSTSSTSYTEANNALAYESPITYPANNTMTKAGHTFAGWSSTPSGNPTTMPDADLTITALWNVNKYTVTWKNYDGSTLETDTEVPYNTTPTYNGSTPAKPQTTDKTFAFTGWSPAISPVADDITYTAQFSESARLYTITWIINGVSTTEQIAYGTIPTHADPEKVIGNCKYDFLGWDVTPVAVTGDATYTAVFSDECTMNNFLVVFQNYDGTPLYATEILGGETPEYHGETPTKPSAAGKFNEFTSWDSALDAIDGHTVYTAQFTERTADAAVIKDNAVVYYGTWANALNQANLAANSGCTLRIFNNVTATNNSSIIQNMTIDLNGYTISCTNTGTTNPQLFNVNNVALTIEDSEGIGSISYIGNTANSSNNNLIYSAIYVTGNSGSVTINGGTIEASAPNRRSSGWSYRYANAVAVYVNNNYNSHVYINGGELKATNLYENYNSKGYAIYFGGTNYGYVDVTGGKLKAKTAIFYNHNRNRTTLSGGYYSLDPETNGTNVTISTGYTKQSVTNAEQPEYGDGYRYKIIKSNGQNCTITWKQDDGEQINQTTVTSGGTPTHADPTKDGGELHQYEFAGWNPEVAAVQNDMTYWATYHLMVKIGWNINGNITYDWVKFGDAPSYTGATPTRAATAQYSYTFTGWDPAITAATCPKTYTAQFDEELRSYTITFANLDGNNSQQEEYEFAYGATPVCPVTPLKEEGGKAYEFLGWSPEIATVTGDATYTATFSDTPSKTVYTITWKDDQGNTIETTKVAEDELPTHTAPEKANTAEYTYTFTGWTPAVVPATANATYTATFSGVKNKYTITFQDWDGTVLQSDMLDYGTPITAPTPNRPAYTFTGWSPAVAANVTGNATYTAQYSFSGNVASVTTTANVTTYYTTWASALSAANSNAGCTLRIYTDITGLSPGQEFNKNMTLDLNGCTLSCSTSSTDPNRFIYVNKVNLILEDSKGGGAIYYEGSGNKNYNAVRVDGSGSLTVNGGTIHSHATNSNSSSAAYAVLLYQGATLNVYGGTLIASHTQSARTASTVYFNGTNTVNVYGGKFKAKNAIFANHSSGVTLRGGYYSVDPTTVTIPTGYSKVDVGNAEPEYAEGYIKKVIKSSCVVTWMNEDGTARVQEEDDAVAGGTVPTYTGTTPTKDPTAQYEYTFDGWSDTPNGDKLDPMPAVTDDATFYAHFTQTLRSYTITWADGDGNELATDEVEYGQIPAYTGLSTPTKTATAEYSYIFNSTWSPTPYAVDKAQTYTAQFTPKKNKYNITWVDGDGNTLKTDKVEYGETPAYTGETPTKTEDANYTYTFNDTWSPAIVAVTGPAEYTAQFNSAARIYSVTLNTNEGTILAGNVTSYTYGVGATLPNATYVTREGYNFEGWYDNSGLTGSAVTAIADDATGDKQFWAKWTLAAVDRELDIVDWTSNSIVINVTNFKTLANKNDWKIRVNGVDYSKSDCNTTTRTLTVTGLTLTANENLLVQVKNGSDIVESYHNYTIPFLYSSKATLSGTTSTSVVYVYGGKLTISGNTTLAALYVCPGAEVNVTGTLTVGKLVLRTKPWATAAISGSVSATNIYYTRIAPDGSDSYPTGQYYQFGLPYDCAISAVRLSDGTTPVYSTTWLLKNYNEETRALNGADGNNWDALASSATIEAGRGYEMFSSVKYYREYYFPVTPTDNTSVAVTRHGDDKNNSGWNIICSPLMSVYENTSDPVTGAKVSWLLTDGSYDQVWPETIWPALPFSYQASANGTLDFSSTDFNQTVNTAPRRAAEETTETEWLHVDLKDMNEAGDHTSLFVHPSRFAETYETGIDVAKQSLTASRAIIYSSHAYGDMAFAGVSDVSLEQGVALTVYNPSEQELTFSLRENNWLNRMAYVWLVDTETGAQINLLESDYNVLVPAGTTRGRFYISGIFKAPQITTDNDVVQSGDEQGTKVEKLLINQKMYIKINGVLYDVTGKLVNK